MLRILGQVHAVCFLLLLPPGDELRAIPFQHSNANVHMGRCHGEGDHFLANTRFCKNCNFSSEIKYFFTKLLEIIINTICNKNIQKL